VDKFLNELIWMARVLRHGRENIAPVRAELNRIHTINRIVSD
jgi:hypothetical protein